MRRRFRIRMVVGALVIAGGMGLEIPVARAQFPVFYGGQVLTPFGNRGSAGSYLNRRQARQAYRYGGRPGSYYRARPRYYSAQPGYYSVPTYPGGYYGSGYR